MSHFNLKGQNILNSQSHSIKVVNKLYVIPENMSKTYTLKSNKKTKTLFNFNLDSNSLSFPFLYNKKGKIELVYDFWTPLSILSILYMTTNFQQNYYFLYFRVRLRQFLGRALRLGQAGGPSTAAT